MSLIFDGNVVYGAFRTPPEVVEIPAGYKFIKLRLRCDDLAKVFLKNLRNGTVEEWEVEFADESKTTIRPMNPVAQNKRSIFEVPKALLTGGLAEAAKKHYTKVEELERLLQESAADTARLDWLEESRTPVLPLQQPRAWICGNNGKQIGMRNRLRDSIDIARGAADELSGKSAFVTK